MSQHSNISFNFIFHARMTTVGSEKYTRKFGKLFRYQQSHVSTTQPVNKRYTSLEYSHLQKLESLHAVAIVWTMKLCGSGCGPHKT